MAITTWLKIAGLSGLYYLIQYSEWNIVSDHTDALADAAAQAWIDSGASLATTSGSVRALCYVVDKFNLFMESIENSPIIDEFKEINSETGMLELPDFHIKFPNGLVIKIIDSSEVCNFRLTEPEDFWQGFSIPMGLIGEHKFRLCMRLKSAPLFDIPVPGTEGFQYEDFDGVIRLGSACTPPKGITSSDIEYVVSCTMWFAFICDVLRNLGLSKVLNAWFQNFTMRRSLGRVRNKIEDVSGHISDLSESINLQLQDLDVLKDDWFSTLDGSNKSKVEQVYRELKRLGYRPYG